MDKPKNEKEVEEYIRIAYAVDRLLPLQRPKRPQSPLGRLIAPDDSQMGLDDRNAESQADETTPCDYEIWDIVMTKWMPALKPLHRAVVARRAQGMGWKLIAYELHASKRSVQYWHADAVRDILNKLT